ncbi:MAG: hypothetical protein ACT4O5_11415 [Gammaproteobacteria bacterium]
MNRVRKIKAPLTLCASALASILALGAPALADEPDEELEVTMDVLDGDEAAGAEMVLETEDDADDADSDEDSDADSDADSDEDSDADLDDDSDADSDEDADEHEEDDDSDGHEDEEHDDEESAP